MSQSNRPLVPSQDAIAEWLQDTQAAQVRRRDEILAGYKRFTEAYPDGIPDEEVQRKAADFASAKGIIGTFLKQCETERTREKKPFLDGGRAVEHFFKDRLMDPVERCQHDLRGHMAVFASKLEAERREAARLEAERLAAEAAAAQDTAIFGDEADQKHADEVAAEAALAEAAAAASAAELSRTRGDLGTVVSLRSRFVADYEASDLLALVKAVAAGKAPLAFLQFNQTRINYAIRSEKLREAPGLVIKEERTVV